METRAVQILKALSEETRLRIVAVLRHEPLSVNELISVLEMGQSRVSRHLKILSDAGILEGSREGSRVYYGLRPDVSGTGIIYAILHALGLQGERRNAPENPGENGYLPEEIQRDLARLENVILARRHQSLNHFQNHSLEMELQQSSYVDFEYYRSRILDLLPERPGIVLDLGSGGGELSALLARRSRGLICVDQSANMLQRANSLISEENVDFRIGTLEHLPLRDREADTVIASMVLHHLPDPMTALNEARRVLKTNGVLIVADLEHHNEEVMRNRFADFWLGFKESRLVDYLGAAGFSIEARESGKGDGKLNCLVFKAKGKGKGKSRHEKVVGQSGSVNAVEYPERAKGPGKVLSSSV